MGNLTGVVSAVAGLALFAWFLERNGTPEIWNNLRQVGWGFLAIIAITGARFAMRAAAWRRCLEPPHRMPFGTAFTAVLAGDAVGNLIPLGLFASEPAKAAFVRDRMPLEASLTALAIENIFYTLSAFAMIAASTIALLLTYELPLLYREAAWVAVAAIVALFAVVAWLLWKQPSVIRRVLSMVVPRSSGLYAQVERLHVLEERIYAFSIRRSDAIGPILAAEAGFHALGVLEHYVTWWLMQPLAPPPLLVAFILEGATRLITVVFKFVPLQIGVGEVATAAFTRLLGFGPTPGISLALVRKARIIFWVIVGTSILVRRGVSRART